MRPGSAESGQNGSGLCQEVWNLNLAAIFNSLPPVGPDRLGAEVFSALPVPGLPRHRIGKNKSGSPALLIGVREDGDRRPPAVELANLQVAHDVTCAISQADGTKETGRFSVVQCRGLGPELHAYFLRVSEPLVQMLGGTPTRAAVSVAIDKLVELFSSMSLPSKKTVQGLWAEVFLIAQAANPEALLKAWHVEPVDRYDFSSGPDRIEVKSYSGKVRRHHFTLEQLRPPRGTRVLVASINVLMAGGGVSLSNLIDDIRARIGGRPELIMRLEAVVAAALGECWPNGLNDRFDREAAQESLRFYDAHNIPSIDGVPPSISEVRFVADISATSPIEPADTCNGGDMLTALGPRRRAA